MFLLLVSENEDSTTKTMYECNDFQLTQNEDGMVFSLNREGVGENFSVVIEGEMTRRIFVMSNTGKTIDRYYWKVK